MYNCEREARDTEDNRRRAKRGRNKGVDEEPPTREEVMAVVRRFFEPYQRRLVQMAVRTEEMRSMGSSSSSSSSSKVSSPSSSSQGSRRVRKSS